MATWRSLSAAALCLLAAACARQDAPRPVDPPKQEKPSLAFDGFKARGTLAGVKQWEAEAKKAWMFRGSQSATAEQVAIVYFQKGKPVSRAWADKALIDLKSYDLEAEGNVVVHAENGVVLETDRLRWDNRQEKVSTLSSVRVLRGRSVLTGKGLVADRKLEQVEVQQDVQVETVSVGEFRRMSREKK